MLESLKCNHLKFEAKPASKRSIELAPWYSTEINVSMSESITMVTWTTSKRTICLSAYVHEYYILKIIFGWLALVWYTRIERELRLVYKHRVQIHPLPWAQWYKSSHVKTECVKNAIMFLIFGTIMDTLFKCSILFWQKASVVRRGAKKQGHPCMLAGGIVVWKFSRCSISLVSQQPQTI